MIIILEAEKDNYVTNIKTKNNDGSKANVGQAATLDLYKLHNENKNSKSWAAFKFTDAIANAKTFTVTDCNNVTKTFEFHVDQASVQAGNIVIAGTNSTNQAQKIAEAINAVADFEITAYNNSNNELILKQNKPGESGDTSFTFTSTNIQHVGTTGTNIVTKFARVDYSAALIKFDLNSFKQKFGIEDTLNGKGAFSALKAKLILKDVTTGISKPKNFSLEGFKLLKEFKEGVGRDTIHFSDKDNSNFINLNDNTSNNTWNVSDYITKHVSGDILSLDDDNSFVDPSFSFDIGNEDLILDISEYVKDQIVMNTPDDKGIVIKFSDATLFDNKTYFAKRFGSRHLLNKKLIPQLRILLKDADYTIPKSSFEKERFLGKSEKFYIYNNNSGNYSTEFNKPNNRCSLKLRVKSEDESITFVNDNTVSSVSNFSGTLLPGISTTTINLDRFNSSISSLIKNNILKTKIFWYWLDESDPSKLINAGSFVVGKRYKINTSTNTNFVAIGASDNNIGTVFTATGVGSGDNNAHELVEYQVISKDISFKTIERSSEVDFKNLISSITIDENRVNANDSMSSFKVYFTDTKKEYDAVKTPYQLPSEDLGDVNYSVIDVETDNVLIDYDNDATLLTFDGEKYVFDFYVPKMFKNMRINFKFKYKDIITKTDKFIFNEKYSIKVV